MWRGGGIAFGPQPRNYDKKVNRKVEKLALRRAFTDRVDAGEIIVVDKIADVCDEKKVPKTKKMLAFLNAVAGPMIFLSVVWGIYSIGDVSTLR